MLPQLHLDPDDRLRSWRRRDCHLFSRFTQLRQQTTRRQCPALTENHGPFEDILQFADVAGLMIAPQQRSGLRIQLGHGLAELLGEPEVMAAALLAGADGYLIKGSSQSLVSAIRTIARHAADRTEEVTIGHSAQPLA